MVRQILSKQDRRIERQSLEETRLDRQIQPKQDRRIDRQRLYEPGQIDRQSLNRIDGQTDRDYRKPGQMDRQIELTETRIDRQSLYIIGNHYRWIDRQRLHETGIELTVNQVEIDRDYGNQETIQKDRAYRKPGQINRQIEHTETWIDWQIEIA